MAFSGQVMTHRPHCTQFFSMNLSCGLSGLSSRALAGQALTQLKHSVQVSTLTSKLPNGEPLAGSAMASGKSAGAWVIRWSSAMSSVLRFSWATANRARLAGTAGRARASWAKLVSRTAVPATVAPEAVRTN